MANEIEKLNLLRKNIVRIVFLGTVTGLGWMMAPHLKLSGDSTLSGYVRSLRSFRKSFETATLIWAATILVFTAVFWLYKKRLRHNPIFKQAVYDERVKLNWLKAYRFAFLAAFVINILWKSCETAFSSQLLALKMHLPNGPFLVLATAVTALTGSFLFFNREANNG